jgi:hypothetical protein
VKLTDNERFLRDYILERIVEKYAKLKLNSEELKDREIAISYPLPILHTHTHTHSPLLKATYPLTFQGNSIRNNGKRKRAKTPQKHL